MVTAQFSKNLPRIFADAFQLHLQRIRSGEFQHARTGDKHRPPDSHAHAFYRSAQLYAGRKWTRAHKRACGSELQCTADPDPSGCSSSCSNAVDPFVQIVAGRSLSKNWTVCSAHSIFLKTVVSEPQNDLEAPTSNQGVIYQPTFAFIRKLSPKADFFTEYVGNFQKSTLSNQIVDCATLYRFRRNQQVSARLGIGLTKASPTAFVEFGYSVLLGKILR